MSLNSSSQRLELFGEVMEPLGDEVLLDEDCGQGVGFGRWHWVSAFCLKLFASQDSKMPQAGSPKLASAIVDCTLFNWKPEQTLPLLGGFCHILFGQSNEKSNGFKGLWL